MNDLYKISTLVIFLALLAIAVGFSVIAFRLINGKRGRPGLMSPVVLRIWGAFFGTMSLVVLIDAIVQEKWTEAPHYLTILTATVPMSFAAFVLARRRTQSLSHQKDVGQQDGAANAAKPPT